MWRSGQQAEDRMTISLLTETLCVYEHICVYRQSICLAIEHASISITFHTCRQHTPLPPLEYRGHTGQASTQL